MALHHTLGMRMVCWFFYGLAFVYERDFEAFSLLFSIFCNFIQVIRPNGLKMDQNRMGSGPKKLPSNFLSSNNILISSNAKSSKKIGGGDYFLPLRLFGSVVIHL